MVNTANQRTTRSMAARARHVKEPPQGEIPSSHVNSVSLLASRWNIGLAMATVILIVFVTVRLTMSRELQQLDTAIKDMDQAYFQNLTMQLSQMYTQMRNGAAPTVPPNAIRGPRIDHAQFVQGAKIIRFSGEELANPSSYADRMKQAMGFYVPKGACRILSKRLNKNKFLTFRGDRAKLLIELNQAVFLDTFKLEHFIGNPNDTDSIGMMPKMLIVSGIRKSSNNPIILGQLKMPLSVTSNLQTGMLQVTEPRESFEWFQVEVLSNYGRRDLTRLYKIRMYGEIDETK